MSQNKKNKDEKSLSIGNGNPMAEKLESYSNALNALPEGLQAPIAEYVKHHVDLELTPAPVTKADYLSHLVLCLLSFLLILGGWEIDRYITINDNSIYESLIYSGITFVSVWFTSLFLSLILRIQTRKFQISSVLVASSCAFLCYGLCQLLSTAVLFFISPRWLALALSQSFYVAGGLFWMHWFVRTALPSSRIKMVRIVSLSIVLLVVGGLFALSYKKWSWNDEDYVPTVYVIPFANSSGSELELNGVIRSTFLEAEKGAEVFADIHSARGLAFYNEKKFQDSVAAYSKAISLEPENSSHFIWRGGAYLELSEYDQAILDFNEAMRLDKDKKYLASRRAHALYLSGKKEEAIAEYDALLLKEPDSKDYLLRRGAFLYYKGNLELALADFTAALNKSPKNIDALLWKEISERKLQIRADNSAIAKKFDRERWPGALVTLFYERSSPARVLASAKSEDGKCVSCRVCSTQFYSGQWALLEKRKLEAKSFFQAAEKECERRSVEWFASTAELKSLE